MKPQPTTATQEIPAGTKPEAGYDAWLSEQLFRAVTDLDNSDIPRLAHDDVMAELRETVEKHEVR